MTSSSFPPPVVLDEEWLRGSAKPSAWKAWGRNALLFVLTSVSVYLSGGPLLLVGLMSILFAHEMGHYLACRYYRVDATLPFFVPGLWLPVGGLLGWAPVPFVGTFGAVIQIRSPFPNRRALFDIGIAGPLAGFAVCLPVLLLGVNEGRWVPLTNGGEGPEYFGEPLLFQWAVSLLRGSGPPGSTLAIGPLGIAAWFGLLVTALNLMPVGQLDGGHVTYSLWPRWAQSISKVGLFVCLLLLYSRPTWLVWTVVLWFLGRRPHPPTLDDTAPVGRTRLLVGLLGFVIFALCFTPSPFQVSWHSLFDS